MGGGAHIASGRTLEKNLLFLFLFFVFAFLAEEETLMDNNYNI